MSARAATRSPAPHLPVASVLPLLGLAHLDRPFDYQVDTEQDAAARPGTRVRVRFSGRLVDGFVLDRLEASDHLGRLGWLERVVSDEPVLTPELLALCRAVAARYAGTTTDVVRLAIPPRHGRTEQAPTLLAEPPATELPVPEAPDAAGWSAYRGAAAFTELIGAGGPGRAAWQALPGEDWALRIAELATHAVRGGHGVIVVVPDQRDLDRVESACRAALGDRVVALSAGLGPSTRYRRWLRVLRGTADVVVGTRSAGFAPVHRLGLMVVFDDGDDSLTEPRAPYPHPREVAVLRTVETGCALVIGGTSRTAETQILVESGWMHDLVAERATVRDRAPRIAAISDDDRQIARDPMARVARIPAIGFDAARRALADDTGVLISVPRRGYHPSLACERCRTRVRCRRCRGPMFADGPTSPRDGSPVAITCRWCGRGESSFRCAECGDTHLRALTAGARRTAEELGKAFPGVPVVTSGGSTVVDTVESGARVVVATPGAEPVVPGGYGAAILLDTWAQLDRADLRAGEQTLRRWLAVLTLVAHTGSAVVVADASLSVVQAAIRWDPVGFAAEEVRQRAELRLPPAVTMVSVDGSASTVGEFVRSVALPDTAEILGPVDLPGDARPPAGADRPGSVDTATGRIERVLLRAPRTGGRELVEAIRLAQVHRTSTHESGVLRVQVDPPTVG
ncbi:primosome assembly protein PriA [Williamsia sp. Leaf354]|uniref:primosomal protein N' n=1 Tax=Williamsia sp. Leaf354 TaxID=1736349 RepID=UPI0006FEFFE0|nr:primosomal protein N' [Williamsia sp. Leaf354]KQR98674.1 primosome assembly protein PriA [Williamsia sp. Leaf354]